jgi:hypothetical protein
VVVWQLCSVWPPSSTSTASFPAQTKSGQTWRRISKCYPPFFCGVPTAVGDRTTGQAATCKRAGMGLVAIRRQAFYRSQWPGSGPACLNGLTSTCVLQSRPSGVRFTTTTIVLNQGKALRSLQTRAQNALWCFKSGLMHSGSAGTLVRTNTCAVQREPHPIVWRFVICN